MKKTFLPLSLLLSLLLPATSLASFGPPRPTFSCQSPTHCVGSSQVTFNSFTNAPNYGDERTFFDGKDSTMTKPGGFQDQVQVHDGEEVFARIYFHNDGDPAKSSADLVAHNVKINVLWPAGAKTSTVVGAAITADNATPKSVTDTLGLQGAQPFTLSMVPGSAQFQYRPDGVHWKITNISDDVVGKGATVGDIKPGFQYSGFVTLKIKVSMAKASSPGSGNGGNTKPTSSSGTSSSNSTAASSASQPASTSTSNATPSSQTNGTLPQTGPESAAAGVLGATTLTSAALAYRRSKKALFTQLLNRK